VGWESLQLKKLLDQHWGSQSPQREAAYSSPPSPS
jgi:hypothetical protein